MNRKSKITLRLAAIAVVLGLAAQFYTNYKIDETLKHFPYHLRDQLTLNITQTNKNFFQRELSLELTDDKSNKTEIITSKLTALPFAITADFELPTKLIKELNKKLNITIDKNTINSKFSVIGDYLQSSIVSEFRDFTNKSQSFEMNLNLASKTQFMDISASLTGLKYDSQNEIKNVKTSLTLIPIGQSKYDLSEFDISIDNANIYLFDGEDTHITLDKITYNMNKKLFADTYDLSGKLTIGDHEIFTKKNENAFFKAKNIATELKLTSVPNSLIFSDIKNYLNTENINYMEAGKLLLNLLLKSKDSKFSITVKNAIAPKKKGELSNLSLKFNAKQNDNNQFISDTAFNLEKLIIQQDDNVSIDNIEYQGYVDSFDFKNYVTFIEKLLENNHANNNEEDNVNAFSSFIKNFVENYPNTINSQLKIGHYANKDIQFNNLEINSQENISTDDKYKWTLTTNLKEFIYPQEHLSINDLKLNIPLQLNEYKSLIPKLFFRYYMEQENKTINDSKPLNVTINNANLDLNLGAIESKTLGKIQNTLSLELSIPNNKEKQFILDIDHINLNNFNMENTFTIEKSLIDNQENSLSQSLLWQNLIKDIKPYGELNPYFTEDDENYILNIKQQGQQRWFNGKTVDEINQQLLQKELSEENHSPELIPSQDEKSSENKIKDKPEEKN